jgi:hypothetical protein
VSQSIRGSPAPRPRPLTADSPALRGPVEVIGKVSEFLDEHPLLRGSIYNSFALFRVLKAFPKFIYPTISGATPAERSYILQVLDTLPLKDVNSVKSITVVPTIPGASGTAHPLQITNMVRLARDQISLSPEWFREVVIHEVGHTKDFDSAWFGLFRSHSSRGPWGQEPFVSPYARTNRWEDYAESFADYHLRPEHLKHTAPEKYVLIKQQEEPNVLERLIDQKPFRETGKWIGEHVGQSTALRTAVQALYWATGGVQILKGLSDLQVDGQEQNPEKHYAGILNVAAGTLFASKLLAFAGLGVQGAHRALSQAIERGQIRARDADAAVRTWSDPVERIVRYFGSKVGLTAPFRELAPDPDGAQPRRALAAGVAVGGAVGGLVGGFVGPYLGVLGGYAAAGPVGGALGLVVGGLAGYAAGSSVGGWVGGAIAARLGE